MDNFCQYFGGTTYLFIQTKFVLERIETVKAKSKTEGSISNVLSFDCFPIENRKFDIYEIGIKNCLETSVSLFASRRLERLSSFFPSPRTMVNEFFAVHELIVWETLS